MLGVCTAEITGTVGFTYANNTSLLRFIVAGAGISVANTAGAYAGIIRVGDAMTLSTSGAGGEAVTGAPVALITITSP